MGPMSLLAVTAALGFTLYQPGSNAPAFVWEEFLHGLIFHDLFWVSFILSSFILAWDLTIGVLGLWAAKRKKPREGEAWAPGHRFAFLIPAHNEEKVIGYLLDSLSSLDYPDTLFDVYVAADRCTDGTAEVAREKGAFVIEREGGQGGKTWNVRHALRVIPLEAYDALVIIDADNLVDPGFLKAMDRFLTLHPEAQAVQGYVDVKNPRDGWIPRAMALSYWLTNSLWQDAREKLGLSPTLGGTGMVFRTSYLLRRGWQARSLTEDLELYAELVAQGDRVYWCHEARVYDEKPNRMLSSYRQRVRWYQGHFFVFWTYGLSVLKRVWRGHGLERLRALDTFFYLAAPWNRLLLGLLALGLIDRFSVWSVVYSLFFMVLSAAGATKARFGKVRVEWIFWSWAALLYAFMWFPVALEALFKWRDQSTWVKTEHTAQMGMEAVLPSRKDTFLVGR